MSDALLWLGLRLVDLYLVATVLLLIAAAAMRLVRQPVRRLAVAWAAMSGLALVAVLGLTPGWPRISLLPAGVAATTDDDAPAASSPAPPGPAAAARPWLSIGARSDAPEHDRSDRLGQDELIAPVAPDPVPSSEPASVSKAASAAWTAADWTRLGVAAYLAGAGCIVLWLAWGAAQTAALCRRAIAAPQDVQDELTRIASPVGRVFNPSSGGLKSADGLKTRPTARAPRVLQSGDVSSAVALGVLRPRIVLPARLLAVGVAGGLRTALAHEWAHVRNRDLWLLALGRVLLVVFFAHPLYWWLRRRIRDDQEVLADAVAAAASGAGRHQYAEHLVRWVRAESEHPGRRAAFALAIWERPSQLARRIAMLLDERIQVETNRPRRCLAGWLAGLVLAAAAMSLVTLQPRSPSVAEAADPVLVTVPVTQVPHAEREEYVAAAAPVQRTPEQIEREKWEETINEAMRDGADYLKSQQKPDGSWPEWLGQPCGASALCTLALLRAGVPLKDPSVQRALGYLRKFQPSKTYSTGLQTEVFCAAEPEKDLELIRRNVKWLEEQQVKAGAFKGAWSYPGGNGDNSNSHFALHAVYEAQRAGATVNKETWRLALDYWLGAQNADGSWGYIRAMPGTGSMTCAGMVAVRVSSNSAAGPQVVRAKESLDRAGTWLGDNFSAKYNPGMRTNAWLLYYLETMGRAANLTGRAKIGKHDWYREGVDYLLKQREALNGAWRGEGPTETDQRIATSLALLFLAQGPKAAAPAKPAEKPAAKPSAAAAAPEVADSITVAGQVLDPEGKPFAGAKIWIDIRSQINRPRKAKIPEDQIIQVKDVDGKKVLKVVHPKLLAVFKRFGIDPEKVNSPQELQKNIDFIRAAEEVMREFYDDYPGEPLRAISGPDGRFRFTLLKSDLKPPYHEDLTVVAVADGFGPAWNLTNADGWYRDATLRLAKDLPIEGRIVDSSGKPVAGAKIEMGSIMAGRDGTLRAWREEVETGGVMPFPGARPSWREQMSQFPNWSLRVFPRFFTTDADGRFQIKGVGEGRLVWRLQVTGPGIAADQFSVISAPDPGIKPQAKEEGSPQAPRYPNTYPATYPATARRFPLRPEMRTYGAKFEHVAETGRVIEGTVRDKATGKPVPRVQVTTFSPVYVQDFTNKEGKYHLTGLQKQDAYFVGVSPYSHPDARQPYVNVEKRVKGPEGPGPMTVDFDLVRGVVLKGKVVEKTMGKPVPGAMIVYGAMKDNPHVKAFAATTPGAAVAYSQPMPSGALEMRQTHTQTLPDGTFETVVLPGRGVICATAASGPYRFTEAEGKTQPYQPAPVDGKKPEPKTLGRTVPPLSNWQRFHALKEIDVPDSAESATVELTVEPGEELRGMIQDPEGWPLAGAVVGGLTNAESSAADKPLPSPEFTVAGLTPGRSRLLIFYHPERQLAAARVVRAGEPAPVVVRLEKTGSVTGRLTDRDGKPLANRAFWATRSLASDEGTILLTYGKPLAARSGAGAVPGWSSPPSATSGPDARFRLDGLISGVPYRLPIGGKMVEVTVRPGETKELGESRAESPRRE